MRIRRPDQLDDRAEYHFRVEVSTKSPEAVADIEDSAYYPNCAAARAAGAAPIHRGSPGYRDHLDADKDGIACEPYHRW